ncbi:MAG: ABC transporter ATP-binding protein [Spirochaetota bacterium]
MSSVFSLEQVSYTYPSSRVHALYSVDLEIPSSQVTAVLGQNGAGKSTLMDLLLGWKAPDTGQVLLQGKPVQSLSKRKRGQLISLVPQNEPLQFSFTLLDYVLFGRAPYLPQLASPSPEDIDIALEALETVRLDLSPQRAVTTLSGGQRQLLMLARAIAQQPDIILLDEPTSSLDPGNTAQAAEIILHLKETGLSVVYTTHDPNFAADTADSVAMLKAGHLLSMEHKTGALTGERLSHLYDAAIEVIHHEGRIIVCRSL